MKPKRNQTVYLDGVTRDSIREAIALTIHRDDSTTIRVMWHLNAVNQRPFLGPSCRPEGYTLRVDNSKLRAAA